MNTWKLLFILGLSTIAAAQKKNAVKLPEPPVCGKTSINYFARVVGGVPARPGTWPWLARLGFSFTKDDTQDPWWLCGGTLISDRHVLTAAHCITNDLFLTVVRLSEYVVGKPQVNGIKILDVPVLKYVKHPKYSPATRTDDIALVTLKKPVKFTANIKPLCLPKTPTLRAFSFEMYYPHVAGFGSIEFGGDISEELLQVQIPVVPNKECAAAYKSKGFNIGPGQLCAGFMQEGGKDACRGDSGGPLMAPNGQSYYLIGVVSYGYGCGEKGFPGIYTRVTSYIDWIVSNMS